MNDSEDLTLTKKHADESVREKLIRTHDGLPGVQLSGRPDAIVVDSKRAGGRGSGK